MSKTRRYLLSLGAAALVGIAFALVLSGQLTGRDDERSAVATRRTEPEPDSTWPEASHARPRRSWGTEANAVCRLGRTLYPNIVLGANTEPDTMDYAVNRLVNEIAAIPAPTPPSARHLQLARDGAKAVTAWRSLATRPIGDVTLRELRQAERFAAAYVDELVAVGATACAPLRPVAR